MGLIGTAISACLFGFSYNFWLAIVSRFLWGLLNGNIGVAKTYMGEILDDRYIFLSYLDNNEKYLISMFFD